jgi:hypothetical protein
MTLRLLFASLVLLALAACASKREGADVAPPPAAPPVAEAAAAPPAPVRPAGIRPDLDPRWIAADGSLRTPPNEGFVGTPVRSTLQPGRLIDQFGGGRFFSPKGEPFAARALPGVCWTEAYTVYRVLKPLPVASGAAVAWFDEPGGATQYEADEPAAALVDEHVLEPVPEAGPAPCDAP